MFLGTARCSAETLGLRSGKGVKAGVLGPPPPKNALSASITSDLDDLEGASMNIQIFRCSKKWQLMDVVNVTPSNSTCAVPPPET
jgi:hypothetical protein